ncbi:MAG: D-glycero-beta-D-manno-heptose-7-phosphate kinase [Thermodesulfobacteriota bacterium]|nr:D-glycero-beta-D-manno-heptose-7-phosphate kinase [Thermodesulfobacteriota bacterium]
MNNNNELIPYIAKFNNARIMVIGDLMVDEYIWGNVSRISPEAPVPVVSVTSESLRLGGAGNVVNNIHSLGGKVLLAGIVGNDEMGRKIIHDLHKMGVETEGVIVESERVTTVKTRIIAQHQQVVRYDREVVRGIHPENIKQILALLERRMDEIDAVLISDYGKGVICEPLIEGVRSLALRAGKILSVDPKVKNFPLFREVTILTPNHYEAAEAAGRWIQNEEDLMAVGRTLVQRLQARSVLITRGEKGMTLFQDNGEITNIPTMAKEVFDVTGAGDTVISVLTLALACGLGAKEAAILSNIAAGIVVGEVGTATIKASELEDAVRNGIREKRKRVGPKA